ncbi:tRNA dimethylallyltransferase [Flavobacterium longum]|uniref:tRNA (adenosine(37)-N6)-dimethylallyltransferase MiaA n=1 Tax=Flavobacterium longum TaxID=1299340 RepID=UPI0039ED3D89
MNDGKKYLIVVVGPTAIGKTARAIALAQHFGCDIISCDSRQFFKEMRIGTAVPSVEELAAATHHFIHNKSIFELYTVGDFEKEALERLALLHERNPVAVMVGGSGLYVDAVLKGFDAFPDIDSAVRVALTKAYEKQGIGYLQDELQRIDPEYFAVVDTENPQRMMRALEVSIGSGKPYSSYLSGKENTRHFTPVVIGLTADREVMYDRINQRVDVMMREGLLDEARALLPHKNLNALQTVGYRELFDYFDGKTDLDTAIADIKKNTRRFAKRQMTWFRKNEAITWFDFEADPAEIVCHINKQITQPL